MVRLPDKFGAPWSIKTLLIDVARIVCHDIAQGIQVILVGDESHRSGGWKQFLKKKFAIQNNTSNGEMMICLAHDVKEAASSETRLPAFFEQMMN